ncbi:hypothetical protein GLOIN_2v1763623 [Rhizophagus irregularis DAOM 181602=DAOM 197198]|uniref:Uncharacterized protein n=3 Tax=Rhizophagus irregularis TaxID=588596 RepID=A0A2P4QTP9_RHIID|nr:hypothetical protein GLOIN_2v1763623 [Rhizophagus irregularis DAOM 181602=DAOM 197198]POG81017.1 hypothetical protein GLOIN_2v1763623 [Rhizophagus irregularis DAOM 181602=DAOM 197198]|eukprot:XP_025187883.1 hypothetical protein GLOIN_2v1763623 [Rhizophagus irregularis DAOM 181602=DAOM 197198]
MTNDMLVSLQAQPMETEIFENVERQSMNVEHDDQNIKHQSEDVIPEFSTKNSIKSSTKLNAKAIPYTQKEKDELARINVIKRTASDSKAQLAKKKQQCAPPKEIQSVMTGYDPVLKDNAIMKDLPKNITTSMLYPSNPTQSPLSHLECKTFKIVQEKSTCKIIMYYKNWVDLEKIMNTKLNLQEYEGVWTRYFLPQLSKSRNRSLKSDRNQKQNQDLADKVGSKTTNNKN